VPFAVTPPFRVWSWLQELAEEVETFEVPSGVPLDVMVPDALSGPPMLETVPSLVTVEVFAPGTVSGPATEIVVVLFVEPGTVETEMPFVPVTV